MRDSVLLTTEACSTRGGVRGEPQLVSNTVLQDFRMIVAHANPKAGFIDLSTDELALLHCGLGESVRTLPLNLRKHVHG